MQILVKGKQIDVGDAFRTHIEERLSAGVAKYFENAIEAVVTISREGQNFRSDCSVHVGSGIDVGASGEAGEAYASFDAAAERIEKQLRRYKRRLRKHGGVDKAMAAQSYVLAPEEEEEGEVAENWQPVIVAETSTDIADCTVGEAVMRMDLANLPAMMFRNKANGALGVVYRRPDGNIGWIEPKKDA